MENLSQARAAELQRRMVDEGIDLLLLTDPDSIYYVSNYWGDLGVEFGRPSILAVPRAGDLTLITAFMELEMAGAMTWVTDIRPYKDGEGGEWADPLGDLIAGRDAATIAVERFQIPAMVSEYLREALGRADFTDGTDVLADMRMIKTPREIEMIRQAGRVAVAMGQAGRDAIGEGVPEFEVSLACIAGGTRMAAEIIGSEDAASLMSPMIHNLQVLNSGHFTSMTHMHPTVRKLERFDPIYLCFCPIAHFKQFKLGFDREYFVGDIRDEQARLYAQRAGIDAMRPGVTAEEVHRASEAVYLDAGLGMSYRTGRAIGYSSLEKPQIKHGDKTVLQPGMAFAVDGGITIPGEFGARVGDTILVTETGTECVTEFPRDEMVL
jgi:Xaa-Pro dipeptidase